MLGSWAHRPSGHFTNGMRIHGRCEAGMQNHRTGESPQTVYCVGTEKKRAGGEGNGESGLNGWDFQFVKMEKFWDGYWEQVPNSVEAFHATELYT